MITYRCLSILPASLYFLSNLLNTRCLRIHWTLVGIRASEVPFLLPVPVWRPFRLAASRSRVRALEWTVVGLIMTRPSLMSFLTCVRELAFPISACSAGSSQILRLPTPATLAARRFCDLRLTMKTEISPCFGAHKSIKTPTHIVVWLNTEEGKDLFICRNI